MSRKFQNYIYYFEFSCSVFPCSQDKRVDITKFFHSILYPVLEYILITTTLSIQKHLFFSPSPSAPTMNLNILFLFNVLWFYEKCKQQQKKIKNIFISTKYTTTTYLVTYCISTVWTITFNAMKIKSSVWNIKYNYQNFYYILFTY